MSTALTHDEIARRIPHADRMVLLDAVSHWDDERIVCHATSHRDRDNPLAIAGRLSSMCAIEYAAQAMAVHGTLLGASGAGRPRMGFLASVRGVKTEVAHLDDVATDLAIEAVRESGDGNRVLYAFEVRDDARVLVSGRAAVVLDAENHLLP